MARPIVEEVRRIRDEHARKFNYDLHAICEDFRRKQLSSGRRPLGGVATSGLSLRYRDERCAARRAGTVRPEYSVNEIAWGPEALER